MIRTFFWHRSSLFEGIARITLVIESADYPSSVVHQAASTREEAYAFTRGVLNIFEHSG